MKLKILFNLVEMTIAYEPAGEQTEADCKNYVTLIMFFQRRKSSKAAIKN